MIDKMFLDIKDGDCVYFLDLSSNTVPKFTIKKIDKITHRISHGRSKSVFKVGQNLILDINSLSTIYVSKTTVISPNKEAVVKIYKELIDETLAQYRNKIKEYQQQIDELLKGC